MSEHKSLTELAFRKARLAHEERRAGGSVSRAESLKEGADELIALPTAPDVGAGGEVVQAQVAGLPTKRNYIQNTLGEGATRIAEDASIRRADLLMAPSFNSLAMAVDAADSIKAGNSLEKMLAHQMAVSHEAALRLLDYALGFAAENRDMRGGESVEACRLVNAASRLMTTYQSGLLALQRLRSGGNQTVTVQHVTVQGQAVIGNVQAGRGALPEGGE